MAQPLTFPDSPIHKRVCPPCNALYEPNPDIAGQAVFISFLVHTSVFIFLAMIVTPIISMYLPPVGSSDLQLGVEGAPPEEVEQLELQEASGYSRREPGEEPPPPRYIYRCHCQQVIRDTYTSQYVAGLAFIVTAFSKWEEISPYHFRVIYSIVSMHSTLGLVANYDRSSFLSVVALYIYSPAARGRLHRKDLKFKMVDFAFLLSLILFAAFGVLVFTRVDICFRNCYAGGTVVLVYSALAFFLLLMIAMYGNGYHGPFAWMTFTLSTVGYVGFQNWQYRKLTQIFRPTGLSPGASNETVFSFGQILVFFMIFPLIVDYFGAILVDLERIRKNAVEGVAPTRTLINLFRILLPWFINRIIRDLFKSVNQVVDPLLRRVAGPISHVASKIRASFPAKKKFGSTRSNTDRVERGSANSGQDSRPELVPVTTVVNTDVPLGESTDPQRASAVTRRPTYPLPQGDETQPVQKSIADQIS
ncbi:hypothetical protein B0O99DRAFT_692108 [Bisporella sp. PMI_857]|nr:hypothetical protein B0O99DRAFT_692108 [Bisporella sp. PMI_857]